jgi:hypothetical protein
MKMKKRTVVVLFLVLVCLSGNVHAGPLSFSLGATYNPLSYECIMGSFGLVAFYGDYDYDDDHAVIAEARFSFGRATLRYNAPNPFTVQHEITELWEKGIIIEIAWNSLYQYVINDTIALRFGIGIPLLFSGVFGGNKPGLNTKGSDSLNVTLGLTGIAGVSIFPRKMFPIIVYISPGTILDPYVIDDKVFKFIMPISVAVGWQWGI